MNWFKQNWFKIVAAIVLFIALTDQPYAYYQMVRWVVLVIGGYSAFDSLIREKIGWVWIFVALIILFNPIIPFYLSKDTWQIFDGIAGVLFLLSSLV